MELVNPALTAHLARLQTLSELVSEHVQDARRASVVGDQGQARELIDQVEQAIAHHAQTGSAHPHPDNGTFTLTAARPRGAAQVGVGAVLVQRGG